MALVYPVKARGIVEVTLHDAKIWPFKTSQNGFDEACSKLEERWHQNAANPILKAVTKTHQCGAHKGRWARHYQLGGFQEELICNAKEAKAFLQRLRESKFTLMNLTVSVVTEVRAGIDLSYREDLWQPGEPITRSIGPLSLTATPMLPKGGVAEVLNELHAMGYEIRTLE